MSVGKKTICLGKKQFNNHLSWAYNIYKRHNIACWIQMGGHNRREQSLWSLYKSAATATVTCGVILIQACMIFLTGKKSYFIFLSTADCSEYIPPPKKTCSVYTTNIVYIRPNFTLFIFWFKIYLYLFWHVFQAETTNECVCHSAVVVVDVKSVNTLY